MTVLSKGVKGIIRACEWIVLIFLAISVVVIGIQVFFRYVLGHPLPWTEQVARYLFIWMTMLGLPMLFYRGYTLAFTLIFDALPDLPQLIIDTGIKLISLAFTAFYFWHSLQYCIEAGSKLAPGLEIPMNVVYIAQPVGGFILGLVLIDQLVNHFISFAKERHHTGEEVSEC